MLDWGFKSFRPFRLFDQGQIVSDALVWGGTKHYVPLVGNGDIDIILPANATGKVAAEIVYQGPIKAPIKKGDEVAVLKVTRPVPGDQRDPALCRRRHRPEQLRYAGVDSLLVLAFGWLL